jgi:hypothetical protein
MSMIGDTAAPAEIEIISRDMNGAVSETTASSSVPLFIPPQGGWFVLVGVRARNIDGCNLTLTASLRDPTTNKIVALEERPVRLVIGDDGWGAPDRPEQLDNFANLSCCPNAGLTRDLYNQEYTLELDVTDREGKKASATQQVFLVCGDLGHISQCECQCKHDYVLGQSC